MIEDMELKRIFGTKIEKTTGRYKNLHNEELHDLYSLPNVVRMIKYMRIRGIRWTERAPGTDM
jgi:hypothetical protein